MMMYWWCYEGAHLFQSDYTSWNIKPPCPLGHQATVDFVPLPVAQRLLSLEAAHNADLAAFRYWDEERTRTSKTLSLTKYWVAYCNRYTDEKNCRDFPHELMVPLSQVAALLKEKDK